MMQKSPLGEAYLFIGKNRVQRKWHTYKLAFGVMIDKTTAIYLLLICGYIFASFFILGDFVNDYHQQFILIEELAIERFPLILTIFPLRYVIQSFSKPGIVFSSTEYQLSLLPYDRRSIWFLCAIERWIKGIIISTVIGLLIVLITPLPFLLISKYILVFLLIDILMTIPQWKLFQTELFTKLGWLFLMFSVNIIGLLMNTPMIGLLLMGGLVIINLRLYRTLVKRINWDKVTEISDFQLWTMWFISKASEVTIKRQKKYSIFQNSARKKKPFNYKEKAINHQMWKLYLGKNLELILQVVGVLFIMLFVFLFINGILFHIGIAVAIHVYTSIIATFFRDRFGADILNVLPWDLRSYKRDSFKWVAYGGILLLIPVGIYLGINATFWLPFQVLFYCSTFLFIYHVKVDKAIALLGKKSISFDLDEGIGFILLIGIIFSLEYQLISLSFVIILLLVKKRKKSIPNINEL